MRAKLLARIATLESRARPKARGDITIQFVNGDGSLAELCHFKDGKLVELTAEERMQRDPSR